MKTAFVLFDGMTALDMIGVYDPLTRLKSMGLLESLQWDLCARTETVTDSTGLGLVPTVVGKPLSGYQLLVVPGGPTAKNRALDTAFVDWIKTAAPVPCSPQIEYRAWDEKQFSEHGNLLLGGRSRVGADSH